MEGGTRDLHGQLDVAEADDGSEVKRHINSLGYSTALAARLVILHQNQ